MTRVALLICLLAVALVAGCSTGTQGRPVGAADFSKFPVTIADDAGRTVTIEKAPERIISLSASNTELLYALGLEGRLVGVDDYSDYPEAALAKDKVGSFSKPNLERVVSLMPDLILATNIHVKSVVPELEKRGLVVVVFQPAKIDNVMGNIDLLGKLTGKGEAASRLTADLGQRLEAVVAKTEAAPRPKVFMELSPELSTVGPSTFIDDMIAKAGGENIAKDASVAWPKLSPEAVVIADPALILLSDHGSAGGVTVEAVKGRPGWGVISAVKNDKIIPLPDRNLIDRPGPRSVDGLEFLARTLHPDLFR